MTERVVPVWPVVSAILRADGSGEVTINGTSLPVRAESVTAARAAAVETVLARTRSLGRPVRMRAVDPDGRWELIVHPDGQVTEAPPAPAADRRRG